MRRALALLLAACASKTAPSPAPAQGVPASPAMDPFWLLTLEQADAAERQKILAEAKRHPEWVAEIIGLLAVHRPVLRGHPWRDHRPMLVELLASYGTTAVPALTDALEGPDPDIAHYAALALARIGPDAIEAKPVLLRLAQDTDAGRPEFLETEVDCVRVLVALGPGAAEDALPLLRQGLGDEEAAYRAACARGLSRFAPDSAADAKAVLAAVLDGRLPCYWDDTAEAVVGFGPTMAPLLAEVLDNTALGKQTRADWHELATLLGRIGAPETLRRLLRAEDKGVQERGLWAARVMGDRASPLAGDLLRIFETTPDPNLLPEVACALGACGPAADGDVEFFLTTTQRGPLFFDALCSGSGDTDALRLRLLRRRAPAPPPFDDTGRRLWQAVGGAGGEPRVVENDLPLTGFTVWPGIYSRRRVVRALEPLFGTARTPGGRCGAPDGKPENYPAPVWAPEGYAVGGLIVKAGDRVDGFEAVFLRVRPDGSLDPSDARIGSWIGGRGGGPEILFGADGTPVTGITARTGEDLVALGLVQRDASR